MASSSTPVHPARYLAIFLVLLIGAFALVFFTGDKQPDPKLGIDLQGGTRVTLTARTPDGSAPTPEALAQAQEIINDRVNGLGVAGSEVIIDGNNLVITVPGNDSSEARNLGQTARLYIRPVVHVMPAQGTQPETEAPPGAPPPGAPPGVPGAIPGLPPIAPAEPGAPIAPQAPGEQPPAPPTEPPAPQPRPYPQEPPPTPAPPAPPAPPPGTPGTPAATPPAKPNPEDLPLAQRIADEKKLRQSTDQQIQILALQFQATRCGEEDVLAGNDDPNLPLITCGADGQVYLLDKSIMSGEEIENATSGLDQQQGQYVVDVQFKSAGSSIWADFTAANVGTQTAFVLDSKVVSAPAIQEAIPGGRTQITGDFTDTTARELANVLKYGSLPLSFESSEAETVSATLGLSSLRAGLIAGAIGLAAVLLYSLLYYRVLGLLVALSLVASGAMVFAILVLLGRSINYTLDLAGIAGSDHRYRHDRGLVRGVLRTHQRRDTRRPFVPVGGPARLGQGAQDDSVRQRGHLPGRPGALRAGRRPGEGLRVHAGTDHDPRRRGGVPGDLAAGVPGVEVADDGQAGVQRARRGAADRPGTTRRLARDGTGVVRWPKTHPT